MTLLFPVASVLNMNIFVASASFCQQDVLQITKYTSLPSQLSVSWSAAAVLTPNTSNTEACSEALRFQIWRFSFPW